MAIKNGDSTAIMPTHHPSMWWWMLDATVLLNILNKC